MTFFVPMCQLWRGVEMWGWGVYLANDAVEVTEITTARTTEDTAAAETGGILHAHEKVESVLVEWGMVRVRSQRRTGR